MADRATPLDGVWAKVPAGQQAPAAADPDRWVAMVAELARRERDVPLDRITVHLGPYSAFVLVAALQLAWRHPDHADKLRAIIHDLAAAVQGTFTPEYQELLDSGWDQSQDVERGQ